MGAIYGDCLMPGGICAAGLTFPDGPPSFNSYSLWDTMATVDFSINGGGGGGGAGGNGRFAAVPLPGTVWLLLIGGAALCGIRRMR